MMFKGLSDFVSLQSPDNNCLTIFTNYVRVIQPKWGHDITKTILVVSM